MFNNLDIPTRHFGFLFDLLCKMTQYKTPSYWIMQSKCNGLGKNESHVLNVNHEIIEHKSSDCRI